MKVMTIIIPFLYTLLGSTEILIDNQSLKYLDRKDSTYSVPYQQTVMLFEAESCFNCLPDILEHGLQENALILYRTPKLSSLERKALIGRFSQNGVSNSRVVLWISDDQSLDQYQKGILKPIHKGYSLITIN